MSEEVLNKPICEHIAPRGGFRVTFPSGYTVAELHPNEFIRRCAEHMKLNHFPLPFNLSTGWQDRMWDQCCKQNPDIECQNAPRLERGVTGDDIKRFLRTLIEFKQAGAVAVSQEEQDRRIDICSRCPKLGVVNCYGGCGSLAMYLEHFISGRDLTKITTVHKKSCMACGCSVEAKTLYPKDVLQKVDQLMDIQPEYWANCWLNEPTPVEHPAQVEDGQGTPP